MHLLVEQQTAMLFVAFDYRLTIASVGLLVVSLLSWNVLRLKILVAPLRLGQAPPRPLPIQPPHPPLPTQNPLANNHQLQAKE